MNWEINGEQVFCWINGTQYYCTNERGEGIFFIDQVRNDRRQLAGTCQFSVRGLKRESKKNKLRRWIVRRRIAEREDTR